MEDGGEGGEWVDEWRMGERGEGKGRVREGWRCCSDSIGWRLS